jgi:hypothetical protein
VKAGTNSPIPQKVIVILLTGITTAILLMKFEIKQQEIFLSQSLTILPCLIARSFGSIFSLEQLFD